MEKKDDNNTTKLKHAAVSAIAAAAVKAKLLADQEEEQIRQLAASLVEKQVTKKIAGCHLCILLALKNFDKISINYSYASWRQNWRFSMRWKMLLQG